MRPRSFISGNIFLEFSVQCICSYLMAPRRIVYNPPPPPPTPSTWRLAKPEMCTFPTSALLFLLHRLNMEVDIQSLFGLHVT
jgi:hypothetical protein